RAFAADANEVGDKAGANGCKRELFDDAHQTPQTCSDNFQDLESDLRMHQAERIEILLADKKYACLRCRRSGRGIVAAIEDREFGNRTSRTFDSQHLFASAGCALKDPQSAAFNYKESSTRLALREDQVALFVLARYRAFGQELQLW